MNIIDTHCDVLYKLQQIKRKTGELPSFQTAAVLDANMNRLRAGRVYVQFFAIFVDPTAKDEEKWRLACEQIDLFQTEIIEKNPKMIHIREWSQLEALQEGEIGAVLALEGVEPIGHDLEKLMYLYEQGVLSVGLTWNQANLAADGALEQRHGRLTPFGEQIVQYNNEYGILTDVSHLSARCFWDVLEQANYVFASHSNVRTLCDHPRNLSDLQLSALFAKGGVVHVTFYPPFIHERYETQAVTTSHLLQHIEYLCSLGGVDYIGFGSDFDGIDLYVEDLQQAAHYASFVETLKTYFTEEEVAQFMRHNFLQFIRRTVGGKR